MKAFYPASFLPRPWVWGLVALVVALHLLGLQTLSSSLSGREQPAVPTVAHLRLSMPAPKAQSELSALPVAGSAPSSKVAKVVAPPAASSGATARLDTPEAGASTVHVSVFSDKGKLCNVESVRDLLVYLINDLSDVSDN